MLLAELVAVADSVAATRSRSEKVRLLAACLAQIPAEERATGAAWLAGIVPGGPAGVGPAAIHAVRGVEPAAVGTLTIAAAAQQLGALRAINGKGSAAKREAALAALFRRATRAEQDFLARLLLGELRQGALEGVMADAIAAAAEVPASAVRRAIMLAGAIAPVAEAALGGGSAALSDFCLRLYAPLSPMLASPADDVASALTQLGEAVLDYKLDGARVQIHKGERGVRIYSRTGRDVTVSLPEIVAKIDALPSKRLVLDGEVIAFTPDGRPRPFQETMRRFGRKLGVAALQDTLPLSLFAFDVLHVDGEDTIDAPMAERMQALIERVPPELVVPRIVTADVSEAEQFMQSALALGHEGLVAKALHKPYEAGNRGSSWLKIKVAETLDLVVVAAEWGNGRRRGWLSNLHLGARDEHGGFVMLGKTFKGLTDELLEWQTKALLARQVATDGHVVQVRPDLVVEIAFNEVQASSRYPGGLALRFARVLRYRDDKTAEDADTMETVRAIAARRSSTSAAAAE